MSSSRLSKQGQVVSMWDTFIAAKTKTGPHKTYDWAACDPRVALNQQIIH